MTDEHDSKKGEFKVTDRRRFDAGGHEREGVRERTAEAPHPGAGEGDRAGAASGPEAGAQMPPMTFSAFLLSLATSAQVHLGAIPNPMTGKTEALPAAAREVIDLLGMIQEKTRGNLSAEEDLLLQHLLYDLRMLYVELTSRPHP